MLLADKASTLLCAGGVSFRVRSVAALGAVRFHVRVRPIVGQEERHLCSVR